MIKGGAAQQNATAIQPGRDVVLYGGMSYSEVKDAALDVFEANFFRLAGIAKETAEQRAEEVTEKLLERLQREHRRDFSQANDTPDSNTPCLPSKGSTRAPGTPISATCSLIFSWIRHATHKRDIMQIVLDES